ncbi:hypothetical protein [Myroides odoratus]|uniref:Uncharacterized protein n=1 Tax=Myroides odoratus TaxID=256 RepID=A0A378RNM7_MYROD|nr:hypothetical protein [Myroides odoratus]QQU04796.1 hypothetical protein I6I89_05765 [Myroides odoratus]STZ27757.1 Uncharacterised protein [Myroides odoratus]
MRNKIILDQLRAKEKQMEQLVCNSIERTGNSAQKEFYHQWKNHNREEAVETMFYELRQNVVDYWLNEKYTKGSTTAFNLLYLEQDGLYGGEFTSFAIDFRYPSKKLPQFEVMDDRFHYLENRNSLPACVIPLLDILTQEIQGKEYDFEEWDDVMDMYNLFETTAYIDTHQTFLLAHQEGLFQSLPIQKPFYIAVGEHDAGAPQLIYVME